MNARPDNWREGLAPTTTRARNGPQTRDEWGGKEREQREGIAAPERGMKGGQVARRRGGYPSRVTGRAERAVSCGTPPLGPHCRIRCITSNIKAKKVNHSQAIK